MKRGDVVVVALPGDLGKPRPAVVVQSNFYSATTNVALVPITSNVLDSNLLRVTIQPSTKNGLRETSQLMTDRMTTVSRQKIGTVIGSLDASTLNALSTQLALFLDLA